MAFRKMISDSFDVMLEGVILVVVIAVLATSLLAPGIVGTGAIANAVTGTVTNSTLAIQAIFPKVVTIALVGALLLVLVLVVRHFRKGRGKGE